MRACEQRISPVSTAYDALVNGSADSYGLAMAYKAVCDALNIPCQVVSGRFQGTDRCWNIVQVGGNYYHLDLSMQSETLWLRSDESMRSYLSVGRGGLPGLRGAVVHLARGTEAVTPDSQKRSKKA